MGEVKVEVTLTNAFEDSQRRRGQLERESVRSDPVTAPVEAGAVNCVLPPFVADPPWASESGRREPLEERPSEKIGIPSKVPRSSR